MTLEELQAAVDAAIEEDYSRKRHLMPLIRSLRQGDLFKALQAIEDGKIPDGLVSLPE